MVTVSRFGALVAPFVPLLVSSLSEIFKFLHGFRHCVKSLTLSLLLPIFFVQYIFTDVL